MLKKFTNSFFAKSGSYLLLNLLGYFVGIITIPFLTRYFSKTEFGYISLIEAITNFLVSFCVLGVPQAIVRYYNVAKNENMINKFNSTLTKIEISMVFLTFVLSFIAIEVLKVNISLKMNIIISVTIAIMVLFQNLIAYLRAKEQIYKHSFLLGLQRILIYLFPVVWLLALKSNINSYFSSKLIISIILVIIIIFMVKDEIAFKEFDKNYFLSIMKFGVPLILVGLGSTIFSTVDRIIVNPLLGMDAVAEYSVASKIAYSIQQVLIFPINMIIFPIYIRKWHEEGKEKTEQFLSVGLEIYLFLAIPVFFGVMALNEDITSIIATSEYSNSTSVMMILLSGLLIYGVYYFTVAGLFIQDKTFILGVIMIICAFINILLTYVLGSIFGIHGVAIATASCYVLFLLVSTKFASKNIRCKVNIKKVILFLFTSLIMYVSLILLPLPNNKYIETTLRVIVGLIIYLGLNFKYTINLVNNRRML